MSDQPNCESTKRLNLIVNHCAEEEQSLESSFHVNKEIVICCCCLRHSLERNLIDERGKSDNRRSACAGDFNVAGQ